VAVELTLFAGEPAPGPWVVESVDHVVARTCSAVPAGGSVVPLSTKRLRAGLAAMTSSTAGPNERSCANASANGR